MTDDFISIPDTDGDGLQDAEENYGWTVKRDINGDGDTDDILPHPYYANLQVKENLPAYGDVIDSLSDIQNFNGKSFISSPWMYANIDGDGLNDKEEKEHYTDPMWEDTDFDGLSDSTEILTDRDNDPNTFTPTNASLCDTDMDGLKDGEEVNTYKTNPINDDTDGDGVLDGNDVDPLVDVSLTLHIKSAIAYEFAEPLDGGNPDIYFKVYWTIGAQWSSESVTQTFWGKRQVTDVSMQVNVPDYKMEISLQIFMMDNDDRDTELNNFDDPFDINSIDGDWSLHIAYDPITGRWTDEDYIGDYDGYGHSIGDGSDAPKGEIYFDITQNDYDGDGLVYWEEINNFNTDPSAFTNDDVDNDGLDGSEEKKYGTDPTMFDLKLKVALDWDAEDTYIEELKTGLKKASNYLYDATDGYMRFSIVQIYTNIAHSDALWGDADIIIHKSYYGRTATGGTTDTLTDSSLKDLGLPDDYFYGYSIIILSGPNSNLNSDWKFRNVTDYDASTCTFTLDQPFPNPINSGDEYAIFRWPRANPGGLGKAYMHIYLPDYFDSNADGTAEDHPDDPDYYKMITHEFGHYGLYLYDEYMHSDWSIIDIDKRMPTLMANSYQYAELSTPLDYQNPNYDTDTMQWYYNKESCWETFFRNYHDRIWFDLNNDGIQDTTSDTDNDGIIDVLEDYVANSGPSLSPDAPYLILEVNP